MTIRLLRSGFCHWLSVKSYRAIRSPPKSIVASVVVASFGTASPDQPARDTGLASGPLKVRASTVAGLMPTSSSNRITDAAWYRCVDDNWTELTSPRTPALINASCAACVGSTGFCSAT